MARIRSGPAASPRSVAVPHAGDATLQIDGRSVRLTNLAKPFWPKLGITKGDLIRYYADVATAVLPHLHDRAMVMKRYPNGAGKPFFFMKRIPIPHPEWVRTCRIKHSSGNIIDFPMIQDLSSLLWLINLGCIDLNQWYARCDDYDRPDYLHFDLDPTPGATFDHVRETALVVHAALDALRMPNFAKTTGSRGIHVYVPIVRGPTQKQVWTFAKAFAQTVAHANAKLITAEYKVDKRPRRHVLLDYNQNAWGRTLASIYSVRPTAHATVSTPITWREIERGVELEDFTLRNVPERVRRLGDLWKPMLAARGRFPLDRFIGGAR